MKNLGKMLTFLCILVMVLIGLNSFVFASEVNTSYSNFYNEEENSLDIVYVGSSTVKEGIVPNQVWHDYGVTSYSINSAPTHPEVIKIAIDEIARTQSPKLVYIDLVGITYHLKENATNFVREYVRDMPDGDSKIALRNKYDYLIDDSNEMFKGHNNYRDPNYLSAVFMGEEDEFKGFSPVYIKTVQDSSYEVDYSKVKELPNDGKEYLIEILETCKKYPDINFLFGMMPKFINESDAYEVYMLNSGIGIVESYGYKFVNWCQYTDDIGLDASKDMRDLNHLNVYGAIKFTKYFMDYIISNYDVVGVSHSESVVENFNKSYKKYEQVVLKRVNG